METTQKKSIQEKDDTALSWNSFIYSALQSPHCSSFTMLLISHFLRYKDYWFPFVTRQARAWKKTYSKHLTSQLYRSLHSMRVFVLLFLHDLFPYSPECRKCSKDHYTSPSPWAPLSTHTRTHTHFSFLLTDFSLLLFYLHLLRSHFENGTKIHMRTQWHLASTEVNDQSYMIQISP